MSSQWIDALRISKSELESHCSGSLFTALGTHNLLVLDSAVFLTHQHSVRGYTLRKLASVKTGANGFLGNEPPNLDWNPSPMVLIPMFVPQVTVLQSVVITKSISHSQFISLNFITTKCFPGNVKFITHFKFDKVPIECLRIFVCTDLTNPHNFLLPH